MVKVDPKQQTVTVKNHGVLNYDYVVVSLGFCSETFGIPGAKENALQMVDIDTAENIHNHIIDMMKNIKRQKIKIIFVFLSVVQVSLVLN